MIGFSSIYFGFIPPSVNVGGGGGSTQNLQQVLNTGHTLINGNNYQGENSLVNNTGQNVNGFGFVSCNANQGSNINSFGQGGNQDSVGSNTNSFGSNSGYANNGNNVNSFGTNSATDNGGSNVNFFGGGCGEGNQGSNVNAFGSLSATANTGNNVNAFGENSANTNSGNNINAFGYYSMFGNTGQNGNAFGFESLNGNSGSDVNAFGYQALSGNTGNNVNAFGYQAGLNNTYSNVNLFGFGSQAYSDNVTIFRSNYKGWYFSFDYNTVTADRKYNFPTSGGTFLMTQSEEIDLVIGGDYTIHKSGVYRISDSLEEHGSTINLLLDNAFNGQIVTIMNSSANTVNIGGGLLYSAGTNTNISDIPPTFCYSIIFGNNRWNLLYLNEI